MVFIVIFYAGINLGLSSSFKSQVNEAMLQAACFDLLTDLHNFSFRKQYDTEIVKPNLGRNQNDLLLIDNPSAPDSPFVAKDDSILISPDSTDLNKLLDSTKILQTVKGKDSVKTIVKVNQDSLRIFQMSLDSTARLKYFHYQREDVPYTSLMQKKKSKFFVEPSATYKTRSITIDSTGKFVEIKELIAGKPSKIILKMPLEEYIAARLEVEERKKWESLGYAYELKDTKMGLGDLIKNLTDFEIPLPSVGVLSIFGTPKISLKIGGSVQIHGAWRSETTEGVTASRLGNTRNEPDFKQQVQINVNGTIGDKLNIVADWNTERTFEYENQLKIKYTGYEDEMIQSIEAGNVSLQTSPLVGGSEALFGIKAQFKMGPFSLTTIASQKKGETKEVQVTGGTSETPFQKRAYEYSTNHYFIDTVYASKTQKIFADYYGKPTPQVRGDLLVTDIQVWKSINVITTDKSKERDANVYINLYSIGVGESYPDIWRDTLSNTIPGETDAGRFTLLAPDVDYVLHPETGFITFKTAINEQDIIAVAFRQENGVGPNDDFKFGEFLAQGDTNTTRRIVLKMVKPRNLQPQYTIAWSLMLKNIYPLGVRNVKPEGFEFDIKREIEGQEPASEYGTTRFLNAFGLDLLNSSMQPPSDNIFDYRSGITIFPETGEIIFPSLEPFSDDLPAGLPADFNFDEVYDTTKTFAAQKKIKDKWILVGKSKGTSSSVYQLGFNVVENSVKVLLNGRELSPGSDYSVDYNIGQLTIRNDAALVPGADLKITYEQNDLFQLASKTLLGARGIYDFSKKTKLGFSILNLNQQTLSDKVRIGEEPLSNSIYGLDFSTSADLPIVTKLLDNVFSTREMSTFSLTGEYAYINPDPNTKKSTILSDGGKSIAYIDDFEGTKKTIPIGVSYTAWKDLSPPDSLSFNPGLSKEQRMPFKGKTFWFTETPAQVTVRDIYYDRKQVARADQQVTVMDYVFLPDTPGTYNIEPQLQERNRSWGGIQKILSSTANDLIEENIEFVEFWAQILNAPPDAKVYIDLGRVSEDVIPNNKLDTEDLDRNDAIDVDGKEDTGIDGMTDDQERAFYNSTKSDPSGDNFFYLRGSQPYPNDYFSINGTQGNAILTDIGRIPDTEDMNRNGNLDQNNSYYRYEIPLDTNSTTNQFIAGGGLNPEFKVNHIPQWYLYRVPLKDFASKIGSPSFSDVETIRLFVQGADSMVHFRITEFNLVGNQWQKNLPDSIANTDTVLAISVVSLEENPNYTSPPGVFQERDRTRPDENILRNEQSLSLVIKGLEEGDKREAVKYLFRPLDVFSYRQMKLFIHGEENNNPGSISYADTLGGTFQYSSEVYFRFGGDTNNYYEYRQPVFAGWNEITINFDKLTALKQARGDSITTPFRIPVEGAPAGHFYVIKGNPTLTTVKFLSVGVVNLNSNFNPGALSGEVWVNELRVVGADDSPGWAYSVASSVKLADFATVSFNLSEKNPYFHRLAERFGSRVEQSNWSISTDVNLLKLLPVSLPESSLRLNYSHTESIGKPLYIPGSDVLVDGAVEKQQELFNNDTTGLVKSPQQLKEETETQTISDSWSASNIKIKVPTKLWLIRDTFNAITLGFNYNKSFSRSPTVLSNTSWIWNANLNYGLSLSPTYYINPIDIPVIGVLFALLKDYSGTKIYYTPQNISLALTAKRNASTNITRPRINSPSNEVSSRDFSTTRGFNFTWKLTEGGFFNITTSYSVNISSSLAHLETYTDTSGNSIPRMESEIWGDIFKGAFFGRDNRYQQNFDIRTAPRLPSIFDINKYFTLTASYGASYQWNYDFRQEVVGRSAGFSNKSTVGLTMRWKSLFDPLFKEEISKENSGKNNLVNLEKKVTQEPNVPQLDSLGNPIAIIDSTKILDSLIIESKKPSAISRAVSFLIAGAKYVFLDYEMISFSFSNDNTLSKSGLKAQGTGFRNFWGLFYDEDAGPTRGFMFGLNGDVGPRVSTANTNLSDVYSQKNNFDFKTSRPLWEGAKIDLTWKSGWSVSKNSTLTRDVDGNIFVSNVNATGTLTRSFLTFPPVLFLSVFKSGIKQVAELYNPQNPSANLSESFIKGFESFPILSNFGFLKDVSKYVPRPNWRITWDGLEKLPFFKSIADRISLDHSYSSTYTEGWKLSRDGNEEIQVQKIEYGFAPLVGLNLTFGQLWGGNFSGNLKYSTRTTFDLGITTSNITENFSKDIGFTLQFSKSGFELPLFGVALKNDIEFSFAYSSSRSAAIRYDMTKFTEEGTPQDGTTRVTLEPRIKYTISAKVTLSIFFKRSTVEPEGASRIPPTTTNEAGLDVNISIN